MGEIESGVDEFDDGQWSNIRFIWKFNAFIQICNKITYIYLKGYYSNEVGEDGRCANLCQKSQCHESVQNCQMPLMNKKTTFHQWIISIFFRINQKIIQQNNEIGTKQCAHRALYRYIMNVCWNTHSYRFSERQTKAAVRE